MARSVFFSISRSHSLDIANSPNLYPSKIQGKRIVYDNIEGELELEYRKSNQKEDYNKNNDNNNISFYPLLKLYITYSNKVFN